MSKTLVAYFSASGSTAKLAKTLAQAADGELYEIRPAVTYTDGDLNWNNKSSRSSLEMKDKTARPAIAAPGVDITKYDTIFVGFPIWWYEAPRIIQTFLESYDFSGKTVIPFATSGGSGMGETASILQKSCPAARVLSGKRMSASTDVRELSAWVKSIGV